MCICTNHSFTNIIYEISGLGDGEMPRAGLVYGSFSLKLAGPVTDFKDYLLGLGGFCFGIE